MNLILNIDIIIWDGDCMDSINTPQDLLKFMDDIKYEWMDKKGNFHTELVPEMFTEYSLMSPEEVLKYKKGVCTDQSEFERDWFKKHNYNFDVMSIQLFRENDAPGHAFLWYEENGKYYWFEHAWGDETGIHKYNSYEELIDDIKSKFIIQNDIKEYEMSNLVIKQEKEYPYHISYEEMIEIDNKNTKKL